MTRLYILRFSHCSRFCVTTGFRLCVWCYLLLSLTNLCVLCGKWWAHISWCQISTLYRLSSFSTWLTESVIEIETLLKYFRIGLLQWWSFPPDHLMEPSSVSLWFQGVIIFCQAIKVSVPEPYIWNLTALHIVNHSIPNVKLTQSTNRLVHQQKINQQLLIDQSFVSFFPQHLLLPAPQLWVFGTFPCHI